jgi:hypothetical protein
MLVSERSTEAEAWLSEVDGLVIGLDRADQVGVRHAAYRAAAIAFMDNLPICAVPLHRDEPGRREKTYRVGERFETLRTCLPGYSAGKFAVAVGMARDTLVGTPSLLRKKRREEPTVAREEFYIRDFRDFNLDGDPDITVADWSIPRSYCRLPSADKAPMDIHDKDMRQFGREMSRLAAAAGAELPTSLEEIRAADLVAVPRS